MATAVAAPAGVVRAEIEQLFIHEQGWGDATLTRLPGDASFRRYSRLVRGAASAMLMDAPPPQENVVPFLTVARLLHQAGLAAPQILAADVTHGFLLLEDFGNATYTRILAAEPEAEAALYRLALDVLIHLHRQPSALFQAHLPPYDSERLLAEVSLFPDWAIPDALRTPALRASWLTLWEQMLAPISACRAVLVHRDYHIDNLMRLPQRQGIGQCGLLDFQDALLGHPAYDVVSLLQDARRDLAPSFSEEMFTYYLAAFPNVDPQAFRAAWHLLGTQRAFKIVGIFHRLHWRDGKPQYLQHLPRVWRLIRQNLAAEPTLAPLQDWWAAHASIMQAAETGGAAA
jgi:aminoglycoside/choline kinase family phosphotransferase